MNFPKRGEVWLVSLDPVIGHEIATTRPTLVISNDRNNEYSSTISVLPLTSNTEKIYPFEALLEKGDAKLPKSSKVKTDQIRTVDKIHLIKLVGVLSESKVRIVERALLIHLGFL